MHMQSAGTVVERGLSRREFLKLSTATMAAAAAVTGPWLPGIRRVYAELAPIPTRTLGKTGVPVTIVGLGGEGVLRTWDRHDEAVAVIRRALERGITYCDTAPAYSASQDYYGEALGNERSAVFLASKTHDRTRDGSLRLLEQSLKRLRTDHLDLWQVHDLTTMEELEAIFGKNGAIHALEQARREGMVRFLGVTGHYDPAVLVEAIRRYPFDTVLVALNAADRVRLSFIDALLPAANEHGLGIIGMKVVAKGRLLRSDGVSTMRQALGYVLSLPISTAIIGFRTPEEVDEVVEIARTFRPLPDQEMARLEALARPHASEVSWFKREGS
jgi:aryl-alcohol dehydrogenase-like predicted oxidoreductase